MTYPPRSFFFTEKKDSMGTTHYYIVDGYSIDADDSKAGKLTMNQGLSAGKVCNTYITNSAKAVSVRFSGPYFVDILKSMPQKGSLLFQHVDAIPSIIRAIKFTRYIEFSIERGGWTTISAELGAYFTYKNIDINNISFENEGGRDVSLANIDWEFEVNGSTTKTIDDNTEITNMRIRIDFQVREINGLSQTVIVPKEPKVSIDITAISTNTSHSLEALYTADEPLIFRLTFDWFNISTNSIVQKSMEAKVYGLPRYSLRDLYGQIRLSLQGYATKVWNDPDL
jgi:hypothetical protein